LEGAADVVVVLHPDYQYDPKAVPALIAPILAGDADMTFGSRFAGASDPRSQGMPFYRFMGNRITTIIQNLFLGTRFTEMHSGMRAYRRECLLAMPFLGYSDDFVFESQILVDAVVRRHRVVEVPIPTRYTIESSSLNLKGLFKYVWETVTYTVKRTRQWGRRGRKWPLSDRKSPPVGLGDPEPVIPTLLAERVSNELLGKVVDRLGTYLLPGSSVALVAGSDQFLQQATLSSEWSRSGDAGSVADAVVLLSAARRATDVAAITASARPSVKADGMLALVLTQPPVDPSTRVAEAMWHEGFELVEWDEINKASLLFARPVGTAGAASAPS
jgi:hypothetical protein